MKIRPPGPRRRPPRLSLLLALLAIISTALVGMAAVAAPPASAESNGVGLTPAMGWSSWSDLRYDPNAAAIEAQAAAMVSSGLSSVGYDYVNLDDFWYDCPGSQGPDVDSYGRWVTNASTFPPSSSGENGIEVVANYVHSLGLKFGIYVTPGISDQAVAENTPIEGTGYTADEIANGDSETNYNCGGMQGINYSAPGAQDFVNSWADEFASWGVDYLKIDGVGDSDVDDIESWSAALEQTGRPIHLELSNSLDIANAATWAKYSNGWRTTGDIECYGCEDDSVYPLTDWSNVESRFSAVAAWQPYGGPGAFNDYDSIEVGNGPTDDGITDAEAQSQLSLWAMGASPLILGTNLTALNSTELGYLKNTAVIAVDQDSIDAKQIVDNGNQEVFAKTESNGDVILGLFNESGSASQTVSVSLSAAGISGSATATDLWAGDSVGTVSGSYSVTLGPGAVQLLKLVPTGGGSGSGYSGEVDAVGAGKCLDDPDFATAGGTQQDVWSCNGGSNQIWTHTSSGQLTVTTGGATNCLDVAGQSTTPGAVVDIWPCNGQANQQWTVNTNGTITGNQSGLCLDVVGQGTANGTDVDVWTCNGQTNQQWTLG